ncbi:MAG: hypothetical protein CFE38_06190 [Comamonadaceae bacterium PBBC1]|nr:MAG: hypothetical protein CFE38_06190 [Comamonadaceae bacterium PBBC1]
MGVVRGLKSIAQPSPSSPAPAFQSVCLADRAALRRRCSVAHRRGTLTWRPHSPQPTPPVAINYYTYIDQKYRFKLLMKTKIQTLLTQLNQGLVSREQVLKMGLLTLLSGENLVLVGPPGTGKSLVARRIAKSLADDAAQASKADYFEYLLTKFSTPEEIFGPLSISALKADQFKRNTEGYLPTVRMAFLDEIFKASSSILNALLTILNERVYHNGAQAQKVPLQALIAASNELPNDQEELSALYDRFLVRVFVDYVGLSQLPQLFEPTTEPELAPADLLSVQDLAQIQYNADHVHIAPELIAAVQDIWAAHQEAFKEDRRESLSDRRLKKTIHLLRVSAATNGREAVDLSDLLLLKDCLWNHPDNAEKVRELLMRTLQNQSRQVLLSGEGMVATAALSALASSSSTHASTKQKPGKPGAVVNGYKGSGTADDPLLIESAEDFTDLARPEVGQQGYHFRQTADLDISHISTWPEIVFKGHYDGGNFNIQMTHVAKDTGSSTLNKFFDRFGSFEELKFRLFAKLMQSNVSQMRMQGCGLTEIAENKCVITHCTTTSSLVSNARNSELVSCEADGYLIAENATKCTFSSCFAKESIADSLKSCQIKRCESHAPLVNSEAQNSQIEDCLVLLDSYHVASNESQGGVAATCEKSDLSRCFVAGEINGNGNFSGIIHNAESSTINHCALGKITGEYKLSSRIAHEFDSDCKHSKNISIDSVNSFTHSTKSNKTRAWPMQSFGQDSGIDGDSIASATFKQRYFEHTLGWDFDTVWEWDKKQNRPALRQVGVQAATAAPNKPADPNTVDLLTQQVQANIWL